MIKVDIRDNTATRDPVPAELVGLGSNVLKNLQELGPQPYCADNYEFFEWWPYINDNTGYDPKIHTLGAETLTADPLTKIVTVTTELIVTGEVFDVAITGISGAGYIAGDDSSFYAMEQQPIVVEATVDKPDGTAMVLPIKRVDTGRVIYSMSQVVGGAVTFSFAFPTAGDWIVTEELINTKAQGGDIFTFAGMSAVVAL